MHRTLQVNIYSGKDGWYVAEAVHLPVVTQGKTVDETLCNLREALSLHLADENSEEFGIHREAPVVITMEMDPVHV